MSDAPKLQLYNTLARKKQVFEPMNPPAVGLYICGPTVYGDPHLGHARPAITFDVVFRYLKYLGYKVRYVRNITDVGHLENDADEGEDKIAKKARLEQLEPMEIAQHYTDRYHQFMDALNVERPSIEPRATGHIIEQIEFVKQILDNGFAYEVDGSVYFDVPKYREAYDYGKLSGRENIEEMLAGSRDNLTGASDKRHPADFALWKAADERHIMRWSSPWGEGFPGWHLECSVMSTKYLGEKFDIHGGGMDLKFPHHEAEIAQANACHHHNGGPFDEAKYWMHNNMLTIEGQKMGKSLGNFITLEQLFTGEHVLLEQGFSPMTIRFFTLQAHYRSTLDFSNDALKAAEKGYKRLMDSIKKLGKLPTHPQSTVKEDIATIAKNLDAAMKDDFNTGMAIAELFEAVKIINLIETQDAKASLDDVIQLRKLLHDYATTILGLQPEAAADTGKLDAAMNVLIELRQEARKDKNFALADAIRDRLAKANIQLKDGPEGTTYTTD
ncbi:MAG: cysteine--tRNA ligase [Bacteroidota bacterium]